MLTSYGLIGPDFKTYAKLRKMLDKIKSGAVAQHKVDCYPCDELQLINTTFEKFGIRPPKNIEVFYPSERYPSHTDGPEGGESFFIPLESGDFLYDGVSYPIVPFVLYSFDDGRLHNTNFASIMIK